MGREGRLPPAPSTTKKQNTVDSQLFVSHGQDTYSDVDANLSTSAAWGTRTYRSLSVGGGRRFPYINSPSGISLAQIEAFYVP